MARMRLGQLSKSSHWLFVPTHPLVLFVLFFNLCSGFKHRHTHFNLSTSAAEGWSNAGATWYGSPNGAGSDGGSCGYGKLVSQAPFSSLVTGIGPSLYKSGKECGACYQIKCTKHRSCSRKPVRVVITDVCPGCTMETAHFDLSGTAFGAMAIPGQETKLRNAGVLKIRFARVACDYSGKPIVFRVDPGSNTNYIAMAIEFEEGDGDLRRVYLQQAAASSKEGEGEKKRRVVGNEPIVGCGLATKPWFETEPSIFDPIDVSVFGQDSGGQRCDPNWLEAWCNLSVGGQLPLTSNSA